jgi:hypothetical protein
MNPNRKKFAGSCMAAAFVITALEAGCSVDATPGRGTPTQVGQQTSLELTSQTPSRVAGTYRDGFLAIRFEASESASGSLWVLYKSDGGEMFRVEQTANEIATATLGDYRTRIDRSLLEKMRSGPLHDVDLAGRAEGHPDRVLQMESLPEYAAIPALSQALGERGVNGAAYPVTLPIHLLAEQIHRASGRAVPSIGPSELPGSTTPQFRTEGFTAPLPCYQSGAYTCCTFSGKTTCALPPPPPPPPPPCSSIYPYPDLRCDPNHDDCFGMCGPGCTCWQWVCGDCQYHATCAQHDWVCAQVEYATWEQWLYEGPLLSFYAAQCAGGVSALVAAFGCDVASIF